MPTATFTNLPAEKQERLLNAASREFASRPYNDASINQIIQEAGVPRGSFYMYFRDKEDLFRYLLQGYMDQLAMVLEESLLREGGDVFAAVLYLYDYVVQRREEQDLGGMGAMAAIVSRNSGMQKNVLLEMVDSGAMLSRLRELVRPELLDLRRDRDLGDILGLVLSVAVPALYAGLHTGGAGDVRERLANQLDILKRGMAAKSTD